MLLSRVALVVVLAGCPNPDRPQCKLPAGGLTSANTVIVVAADDGSLVEVHDGVMVPLVRAPQGGHIILVGARLRDTSDCMLDATGDLRDPATGRVLALDKRPLLLTTAADGWAQPADPALSSMPNVAVCPSAAATQSIDGNPYTLELTLANVGGAAIVTLTATVTPSCNADSFCHSDCAP